MVRIHLERATVYAVYLVGIGGVKP
jgi:hypothetical protein